MCVWGGGGGGGGGRLNKSPLFNLQTYRNECLTTSSAQILEELVGGGGGGEGVPKIISDYRLRELSAKYIDMALFSVCSPATFSKWSIMANNNNC